MDKKRVLFICVHNSARCPVFPGGGQKLHWGFPDPSQFQGPLEDKLKQARAVRDQIEAKIKEWLEVA